MRSEKSSEVSFQGMPGGGRVDDRKEGVSFFMFVDHVVPLSPINVPHFPMSHAAILSRGHPLLPHRNSGGPANVYVALR